MRRSVKIILLSSFITLLASACFTEPETPPFNPIISFIDLDGFNIPNIEGEPGDTATFVVAVEVSDAFQAMTYYLVVDSSSAEIESFDIDGAIGTLIAGEVNYVFVDSLVDREAVFSVEAIDTDGLRSVRGLDIVTEAP